tara:strand:+ start:863 stop:1111 length:249 start_codon:yes stop_codon:yes gene_type:complete
MSKKVLTQDEISSLKKLKTDFINITTKIGEVEISLINLKRGKKELEETLLKIQDEEKVLANSLEKKYGQGSISLETGEFLPV